MGSRMLAVDDEEPILFALKEYFSAHGREVDCARDAGEAKALLVQRCYDVVIADLRLGGSDGTEGLEVLGFAREVHSDTRTILLTAHRSPEVETEALRRGVAAVLDKPVPLSQIADMALKVLTK